LAEIEAGQELGTSGYTEVEIHASEPWGMVARGRNAAGQTALVVIYQGDIGRALFEEARPGLEKWQSLCRERLTPALMAIDQISDGPDAPFVVVADPGGQPLALRPPVPVADPRDAVRPMIDVMRAVLSAANFELILPGVSSTTVYITPAGGVMLLPVAPGARRHQHLIAGGRYAAPELQGNTPVDEIHAESHAIAWLVAEQVAANRQLPRDQAALASAIPYPRLRTVLRNGMSPINGCYGDEKLTLIALERWVKEQAEEDLGEIREASAAATRKPWQQWLHDHKALIKRIGIPVGGLAGVVLVLMLLVMCLSTPRNPTTPYGMLNLYFEALMTRDAAKTRVYTEGEATPQTDAMLGMIQMMEQGRKASRWNKAVPQVSGSGDVRNVKVDLKGVSGDLFMVAEMTIAKKPDGNWVIRTLFFDSARKDEE
jgi:hypothetical protein